MSNITSLAILIPCNLTVSAMLILLLQIYKSTFIYQHILDLSFKNNGLRDIGVKCYLSRLNHDTEDTDSCSKMSIILCKLLQVVEIVLSRTNL